MSSFGPVKLINAILCDDIRSEADNNKHILIGTYSGDIRVGAEPPMQLMLSIYLDLFLPAGSHDLELRLSGPGKGSAVLKAPLNRDQDGTATITIPRMTVAFEKEGTFRLDARLAGGNWSNIFKKKVFFDPSIAALQPSAQSQRDAPDSSSQL